MAGGYYYPYSRLAFWYLFVFLADVAYVQHQIGIRDIIVGPSIQHSKPMCATYSPDPYLLVF